ncbi:rab11 family-interacting protein 4B isoform X2 [Onthophagus taurus]|uniref:rab11 family-interacting protein 4B isoform X2 n=1 Tax=Onthophagus taurus TaxID=166361 RepID=UPI000C2071F6|nr:rab11 family-interacting protein 4B isoform X2 [Onthophagus taurus]
MSENVKIPAWEVIRVFKLCDPNGTGKIRAGHLRKLVRNQLGKGSEDIRWILNQLDPKKSGYISFKEFFYRVQNVAEKYDSPNEYVTNSMMSPITVTTTESEMGKCASPNPPRFPHSHSSPPESPSHTNNNNDPAKSQCSSLSDGESYECYVEGGDTDVDSGISSDRISDSRTPLSSINRNTWLRTSLRRSPPSYQENLPNRRWGSFRHTGKRQLGSNALASQLYRSSSFNSSGRSSNCDTADDMHSDASLEEDVLELNHKMQLLQQQVGVLQDSSLQNDERYTRVKAENAALQARVNMLEEQLRDTEIRCEERLQDEQRRAKDALLRLDREKELQLENYKIRLQSSEIESNNLREEVTRQRVRIEKLEDERRELSNKLQDMRNDVIVTKEKEHTFKEQERRHLKDQEAQSQLIEELSREVERLRSETRTPALPTTSPETLRLEELHEEMSALRTKNSQLEEANEELQASLLHASVEQGRLLTNTAAENSLAAELEAMTHDEIQQALKEQQDVNAQLRSYIDGILLNIVENYPQLLEVKHKSAL